MSNVRRILPFAWYLCLAALLIPRFRLAGPPPDRSTKPPTPAQVALAFLASSDAFYGGAIGIAGTPPPQVYAWNTLLQLPRADTLFARLLAEGNAPGQLYALAGLYYADTAHFAALAQTYAARPDSVQVMEGCVRMTRAVKDLHLEIWSGRWSASLRSARAYPAYLFQAPSNYRMKPTGRGRRFS